MRVGEENELWKNKTKKGIWVQSVTVGKEEQNALDMFFFLSLAFTSMDSCLLEDFHLKPTSVMGDDIRLHLAGKVKSTDVGKNRVFLIDSSATSSFSAAIIILDFKDTVFPKMNGNGGKIWARYYNLNTFVSIILNFPAWLLFRIS